MPLHPYPLESARLQAIAARCRHYAPPDLGYATVREFCDSVELLPELATINRDLKDAQRPWALKSILGQVPVGGKLLEIGAGDPHVAHWLSLLGYEVWIIDPYDGSGNGPTDYEFYRTHFPRIHFCRALFSDQLTAFEPGFFDAIYSISVLEHVPHAAFPGVIAGLRRFLKPGGLSLHALDHVLQGHRQEHHLRTLGLLCEGSGIAADRLTRVMAAATADTETYFLSAESHNMWRGSLPYDKFPMRRCISVEFANRPVG